VTQLQDGSCPQSSISLNDHSFWTICDINSNPIQLCSVINSQQGDSCQTIIYVLQIQNGGRPPSRFSLNKYYFWIICDINYNARLLLKIRKNHISEKQCSTIQDGGRSPSLINYNNHTFWITGDIDSDPIPVCSAANANTWTEDQCFGSPIRQSSWI